MKFLSYLYHILNWLIATSYSLDSIDSLSILCPLQRRDLQKIINSLTKTKWRSLYLEHSEGEIEGQIGGKLNIKHFQSTLLQVIPCITKEAKQSLKYLSIDFCIISQHQFKKILYLSRNLDRVIIENCIIDTGGSQVRFTFEISRFFLLTKIFIFHC